MRKFLIVIAVLTLLLVGGVWWSNSIQDGDPSVIATRGIHWHPTLEIYVDDEQVEIPRNIGLVGIHSPVHTHEDLPIIHLEFTGTVREDDIKLGKLFEVWGKDFMEFGNEVRMIVNGVENTKYADYMMQDKDKIVLYYSSN